MKKALYTLLLALMAMANTGCEALQKEVDWAPINLYIYVRNADGADLLDPENQSYVGSSVTALWLGESYTLPTTRAYKTTMNGLNMDKSSGGYFISFGELSSGKKYDDDLVITWGDGTTDTIHLKNNVNELTLATVQTYTLNGTKCDNPIIIIRGGTTTEEEPTTE